MDQSVFSGTDTTAINERVNEILDAQIQKLASEGAIPLEAVKLYNNTQTLLSQPDAEDRFMAEFEGMSDEGRNAYSKLRLIGHLVGTNSHLVANNNIPDDGDHNAYNIEEMVHLAREAGYTNTDLMEFFSDVRIWKAITPHPTEHLNAEGVRMFRELVATSDLPDEEREPNIENVIGKMLTGDITPTRRATTFEETDFALEQASVYRQGQREMFRRVNSAVQSAFDGYAFTPNLERDEVTISTGMRVWHAGGDADGKVNADRWALMYGMLSLTKASIDDHINDLERVAEILDGGQDNDLMEQGTLQGKFESKSGQVVNLKSVLEGLRGRIENLESRFISTDADGNKELKEGVNYDVIKHDFDNLYKGLNMGSLTFDNRKSFSRELDSQFKALAQRMTNPEAREIMAESHFMMSQYGLSASIIETRHNGLTYREMMNNLFSDEEFVESLGLSKEQEQLLESKKMFVGTDNASDGLSSAEQIQLMDAARAKLSPKALREALLKANPEITEDGYTVQTHEVLRRFELMAQSPDQFGMAIIAEADEMSTSYQRFMAEPFGVKTALHTPLNEEYETLRDIPDYLEAYHMNGGRDDINERALVNGNWYGHAMSHGQMIPCSDSLKSLGRLVAVLQTEGIRNTAARSANLGVATLIKWGNGLSNERGGGDEMMYTRYIAQTLQEMANQRGEPLDPQDPKDRVLLQMASFFSNTEQGRSIRIHSATPHQVSTDLCNKLGEMLGRRMELQGLVRESTYIPPRGVYSNATHDILMEGAYDMMMRYNAFRNAKNPETGTTVLDDWAAQVSNPEMAGAANSSARAQSKSSGKKAALMTKQRAIGSNIWHKMARTNHDGYFTCGEFMGRMHKAYNDGQLSKQDVKQFTYDSQWWRRNFFLRSLMPAIRSDMKHGFERLGMKDITFDKAIEIGATVDVDDKGNFTYDDQGGTVTPSQALQAAVFRDQAILVALTEAGLNIDKMDKQGKSTFDMSLDEVINTVRPDDNSIQVVFGSKTMERWPQLSDISAEQDAALPEEVMTDYYEERIKTGKNVDDATKRLATSAARSATMPDMKMTLGKTAYGRRQEPIWDVALVNPPVNYRPELDIEDSHAPPRDHDV